MEKFRERRNKLDEDIQKISKIKLNDEINNKINAALSTCGTDENLSEHTTTEDDKSEEEEDKSELGDDEITTTIDESESDLHTSERFVERR